MERHLLGAVHGYYTYLSQKAEKRWGAVHGWSLPSFAPLVMGPNGRQQVDALP